jgi:hypothetical protein
VFVQRMRKGRRWMLTCLRIPARQLPRAAHLKKRLAVPGHRAHIKWVHPAGHEQRHLAREQLLPPGPASARYFHRATHIRRQRDLSLPVRRPLGRALPGPCRWQRIKSRAPQKPLHPPVCGTTFYHTFPQCPHRLTWPPSLSLSFVLSLRQSPLFRTMQ